jgi:hypothetical protein
MSQVVSTHEWLLGMDPNPLASFWSSASESFISRYTESFVCAPVWTKFKDWDEDVGDLVELVLELYDTCCYFDLCLNSIKNPSAEDARSLLQKSMAICKRVEDPTLAGFIMAENRMSANAKERMGSLQAFSDFWKQCWF